MTKCDILGSSVRDKGARVYDFNVEIFHLTDTTFNRDKRSINERQDEKDSEINDNEIMRDSEKNDIRNARVNFSLDHETPKECRQMVDAKYEKRYDFFLNYNVS